MEQLFSHIDLVVIFAIYAVSLNLLLGYAGQISIAHAAFGAVGAYTAGFLVTLHGWSFFPALAVGIGAAGLVGLLTSLPALYLDVRYLILLTLALSTALLAVIGAIPELGGSYGLREVPNLAIFGKVYDTPTEFFRPLFILFLIVLAVCALLAHSPFGRVLRGIRDDELATRGVGKNVVFYKVSVFAMTAAMAGTAGVMLLYFNRSAQPGAFDLAVSMAIVAMVIVGGTGNLIGSILGATVLVLLEPVLEDVVHLSPTNSALAQVSIYGILIVVFLLVRPQGLLPESWTPLAAYRRLRGGGETSPAPRTELRNEPPPLPDPAPEDGAAEEGNGEATVLEALGLRKNFGGIHAADGLDLRLARGRVTGLIGPNGAGKTTVFNLLTGVIPPDAGSVALHGHEITGWTLNRIAKAGMARSYQDVRVYPRMSVLENVLIAVPGQPGEGMATALLRRRHCSRGEAEARDKAFAQLEFVGIADRALEPVGSLSFGEQKVVALARLLATEADVLLLDEPASGIDIDWVERMLGLIAQLRARGKSICVVEHNLHVIERVADSVYFMEAGKITAEGSVRELMAQARLAEVYFGSA